MGQDRAQCETPDAQNAEDREQALLGYVLALSKVTKAARALMQSVETDSTVEDNITHYEALRAALSNLDAAGAGQ